MEGLLGRRYAARAIDSLIITAIIVLAVLFESIILQRITRGRAVLVLKLLGFPILWIGYGTLLESSKWQATIGKRLMGLRVYDSEAGRLKVSQAAGRTS